MTYKQSYRYINHLGDFNENYNSTHQHGTRKSNEIERSDTVVEHVLAQKRHQSYRRRNVFGNPSNLKWGIKSGYLISEYLLPENMTRNGLERFLLYQTDAWGEDYPSINSKTIWTKKSKDCFISWNYRRLKWEKQTHSKWKKYWK